MNTEKCVFCARLLASNEECNCYLEIDEDNDNNVSEILAENVMNTDYNSEDFLSEDFKDLSPSNDQSGWHGFPEMDSETVENELSVENILTENSELDLLSNEFVMPTESGNRVELNTPSDSSEPTRGNEENLLDSISTFNISNSLRNHDFSPESGGGGGDIIQAPEAKTNGKCCRKFSNKEPIIPDIDANGVPIAGPSGICRQSQRNDKEKRFKCDECGKRYTQKNNLQAHQKKHKDEKPFKCHICNRSFVLRHFLTDHLLIHANEKKYRCNTCGKGFNVSRYLANHRLIHSAERPREKQFKCQICNKSFVLKKDLTKHLLIHANEKKYRCNTCGKGFNVSGYLAAHSRVHSAETLCMR